MSHDNDHEARLLPRNLVERDWDQAGTIEAYRQSQGEVSRSADIVRMIHSLQGSTALDVGARDGHFSRILAEHFKFVTALDLEKPRVPHPNITCVSGDVTHLALADDVFDLVICTEVLEHIYPAQIAAGCSELTRVSRKYLLIGVPFKQDIRVGRTTCNVCGAHNPPWGHINVFDERRLRSLFPAFSFKEVSFVGVNTESTNALSALLMDLAGNPYGTYGQEELCIGCGSSLRTAPQRRFTQKLFTKAAFLARGITEPLQRARPNWIHCLMRKL